MVEPWPIYRNRWFTELNSMVDLSMANCECHNQRVTGIQKSPKKLVEFIMGFHQLIAGWSMMAQDVASNNMVCHH